MRRLLVLLLVLHGDGCVPGIPPPHPSFHFRLPALHAELDPLEGGRIRDAFGREVILRGVNVNAFVDYWSYDPELFTTYPLTPEDADLLAGMGWNMVRLLFSWSRVEPEPGYYDEAYLDELEDAVRLLESRGIYSILDAHQDAWGPSLAADDSEDCPAGVDPAFGWDGAPEWATLAAGEPRCEFGGTRELSPAVIAAFNAFWADAPGPGEVGIQTRYVRMWEHVAARFAGLDAVAGYDVMNEPNAFTFPDPFVVLTEFYERALAGIRAGEVVAGAPRRLFFFEPSILWAGFGVGAPLPFGDDQMVYAPHIYQGGLDDQTLDDAIFQKARDEGATFGGVPVLTGEWGSDPRRAADPGDDYFDRHQSLQDRFRFGATLWTWREACGDPHKAGEVRAGNIPFVWGLFDVDCITNEVLGMREPLTEVMRRPLVRAAPGRLTDVLWDAAARGFVVRGEGAEPWESFIVFYPARPGDRPKPASEGLFGVHPRPAAGGGRFFAGYARGGAWELTIELR
jgi:endoglycosylceramidase